MLKSQLNEISGISFVNSDVLACVNDEKGVIYLFDIKKGSVVNSFNFHDDADFEDIQVVGDKIYVLESDGDIFCIENFDNSISIDVKKEKTPLGKDNNCEGLTYSPSWNSLLIACKGEASIRKKNDFDKYKAVYRYIIDSDKLLESPVMLINKDNLVDESNLSRKSAATEKLKMLNMIKGKRSFQPSAIAIHPISGNVYLLSSNDQILAVYSDMGKLLDVEYLNTKLFTQPEGMCFSKEGKLYIANEANGLGASILCFDFMN